MYDHTNFTSYLQGYYIVRSESLCAPRVRYVGMVVSIEVAVGVCGWFTVFSCFTAVEVQYR
jgi:hypothetical protein